MRRITAVTCCLLVMLLGSACSPDEPTPEPPSPTALSLSCTFSLVPFTRMETHAPKPEDWDAIKLDVKKAEKYVGDFWQQHWHECFPDVDYSAPSSRGIYTDEDEPTCGEYKLGADNAFYCHDGHFVTYGSTLLHRAVDEGDALAYVIVAHEWGHAIQDLLRGTRYQPLVAERNELQADCLAGAALWGSNYEGELEWQAGDTNEAVDALKSIADESPWTEELLNGARRHGDSLERITAFGQGSTVSGVTTCFGMRPAEGDSPGPTTSPSPTPSDQPAPPAEIDARNHEHTGWFSPSGNIICGASAETDDEDAHVRCLANEHTWKVPADTEECAARSDYQGVEIVWGISGYVCTDDPVAGAYPGSDDTWWWSKGDPTTSDGAAVLQYGRSVRLSDALVCTSERTGMTCRETATNQGFQVAKRSAEIW